MCYLWQCSKLKITPKKHKYLKNHTDSVKSTELSIEVEITINLITKEVRINKITTDENSAVIKNLKNKVQYGLLIQKAFDPIHLKKSSKISKN